MRNSALKTLTAASALALTLAGCAADEKTETESGVQVVEEGKLTVCTHLPYEPFQYNQGGEVVGFDVD
nr:ABC transporter substrate-binding protein [Nocardioidaceae bacterium]